MDISKDSQIILPQSYTYINGCLDVGCQSFESPEPIYCDAFVMTRETKAYPIGLVESVTFDPINFTK